MQPCHKWLCKPAAHSLANLGQRRIAQRRTGFVMAPFMPPLPPPPAAFELLALFHRDIPVLG
eukprot:349630-Chlamydomonas_euryale.AAC.2